MTEEPFIVSGTIAAGSQYTADAGVHILRQGGNAVDAAVAAAFASFIAEVGVVHLGGSGLAQIFDPATRQGVVYDFFSNTPGLGQTSPPDSLDFAEVTIDFGPTTQNFHLGRGSVAVPGNIFGLCQMAADYGRLPLATLLDPAIELAQNGVILEQFQAETCQLLAPLYTHTEEMRQVFAPGGKLIQGGERLFIPHLAETLRKLAREGEGLLRNGKLAQALVADQVQYGGLLTLSDLKAYPTPRADAIRLPYHDLEVLLPPPSSTGGPLVAFSLKLLSAFQVGEFPHGSADHLRLLVEVMAATSRARPQWDRWLDELPPGRAVAAFLDAGFMQPYLEEVMAAFRGRQPSQLVEEAGGPANTSHLSVIDSDGLAVSLTTTAGESAGYVVPGTGFIPNNIMGEEDLHPAGFHSKPPGVRIPSMMTPAVVLQDGLVRLVLGSGGSKRIRSAIVQVLSNLLDFRLPLAQAVNLPRVHLEDGVVQCEGGTDKAAMDDLARLGYPLNRWGQRSIYFGGAHSVSRTPEGRLVGAGDNRRGGAVAAS